MKTILFIIVLVGIVLTALYFKKNSISGFQISKESRWDSVLTGSWEISSIISNTSNQWDDDIEIDFLENKQFRLNATEKYWRGRPTVNGPDLIAGGGVTGTWHADDDNSFVLNGKDCSFEITKGAMYNFDTQLLACPTDGFKLGIGTVSSLMTKTKIIYFSKDSIRVEGKAFKDGCDIEYAFTRRRN